MDRRQFLGGVAALAGSVSLPAAAKESERRLIYVASPGIRNYVEYGGVGVLVFDADHGHRFVKRIPTWDVPAGNEAENVKGIAACAAPGLLPSPFRLRCSLAVCSAMLTG